MKKKPSKLSLIVILVLLVTPVLTVMAGSYGFGGGISSGSPLTIDVGSTLSGVGGTDLDLYLSADALVTILCQNHGGKVAPGRNPVEATASSESFPVALLENGKYVFNETDLLTVKVSLGDVFVVSTSPKDLGCPNNNWVVTGIDSVIYLTAYLDGYETSSGELVPVFSYVFACSDPASDGSQTCNELVSKTVY